MVNKAEMLAENKLLRECKVSLKNIEHSIGRMTGEGCNYLFDEVDSNFPLASLTSLLDVEKKIETLPEYAQAMTMYFQKIKGGSEDIPTVFRYIFTNELLEDFNWNGSSRTMGVTGLWKLVEPCGNPVPLETLEGKILAVDISIWLHQVVKGFQDSKGSLLPNAHLLGLFHRLCKLLYFRVRPVFVFDGCVPQLKRDTIARRQHQRSKLNNEADRIQALLLQSLAKEKVVQQALGINAQLLIQSPSKRRGIAHKDEKEKGDLFKLPNLRNEHETDREHEYTDSSHTSSLFETSTSTEDNSFDESNPWREYNANLQAIDVRSVHFKSLPPEVRHEVLVDIKETRKQSSWGRLHELPSCSDDFSSFQMKRLLKRRAVQESIEETEKEMGERALTFADLQDLFTEEGILDAENANQNSKPICSDEDIRFTLVRDLKKILAKNNKNVSNVFVNDISQKKLHMVEPTATDIPSSTNKHQNKNEKTNMKEQPELPDRDYDTDLEKTIALSVEPDAVHVYAMEDYEYVSNENLRLNPSQRNQLKNTATGPARAFMVEYGGMNDEEVKGIMDKTQADNISDTENLDIANSISASLEDMQCARKHPEKIKTDAIEQCTGPHADSSQEICLQVSDSSETDSDLEEVAITSPVTSATEPKNNIEVIVKIKEQLVSEDDLFSDIFESSKRLGRNNVEESDRKYSNISPEKIQGYTSDSCQIESSEECSGEEGNKYTDEGMRTNKTAPLLNVENINDNIEKISSILDELKKQADDVKNISLDDVGIDTCDDKCMTKHEIIEICDSDDEKLKQGDTPSKSPKFSTPSKNKGINGYFDTKYIVKRTPENYLNKAEERKSPHVKSPFFVKKSPSCRRKGSVGKSNVSPVHGHKFSKVSKTLFDNASTSSRKELGLTKHDETEVMLENADSTLKDQKKNEQLQMMASDLAKERFDLENERNRQDRMGSAINQKMLTECQELLKLFGIPYIIAPMEAEAQCAFLDSENLTHGTITDDSDIWLFGGRTVYKNFFEQNKHVLKFEADQMRHTFNCDREKLIQLACLVGSDYTKGIHGIGTVTALEILAVFSPKPNNSHESNTITHISTGNVLSALCRFRDWLITNKDLSQPVGSSSRLKLRKKLRNIELNNGFPNPAVIEAYLYPKVDDSKAPFRWGYPDVESIHAFTKKVFGWTTNKTDIVLKPVLKRISDKQTQSSIRNYFTIESTLKPRDLKVSKRVQKAIDTMAGTASATEPIVTKHRKRSRRSKKKTEIYEAQQKLEPDSKYHYGMASPVVDAPSTSAAALAREPNKCTPKLPATKEVIPQRERYIEEMRQRNEKAVAVLRKCTSLVSTATSTKKKRINQ